MTKRTFRNRWGNATTSEFACALFVFFLIILFPLINLIGFALGAGTQYMMTVQCAGSAGSSPTFASALTNMENTATSITSSGFGKFGKLQPVAGFGGSGTNLYILSTPLSGGPTMQYGPNNPFAGVIDENLYIYEYQVRSNFDVGPFVNLSAVPFIGGVPGVGQPARLSFVAQRMVEFDEGLASGGNGTPIAGAGGSGGSGGSGGGSPPVVASGGGTGGGGGGDGSLTINGFKYSQEDIVWWTDDSDSGPGSHSNDVEWDDQPNPFLNRGDPSTFADGTPNPYYNP